MASRRQKISQMTPKGANLQATDLLEISEVSGTGYITKSITGQQIINAGGGGGSQDLQQVTDLGATTTNGIAIIDAVPTYDNFTFVGFDYIEMQKQSTGEILYLTRDTIAMAKAGGAFGQLKITNVTPPNNVTLEFPNKATGSYTIATTADLTSGYVPYTGATANVDLGTFHLDAAKGTFTHNGSTDTLTANHTSGAGIGLLINKGGNNEGLKVNKTSGSGNAATIIGTLEATTIVKTGGTSTEFLMADGSINTAVVPTTRTLNGFDLSVDRTFTTANIADSVNKRYVTDANLTVLGNTSNTNTGDETQASILSKLGVFYSAFTPSSTVTGTTSETQVAVVTIPANTIRSIDNLRIYTPVVKSGTTGICTVTYKLSTSATMPSGTTDRIAVASGATGSLWIGMSRNASYNGGNLIIANSGTALVLDLAATAQAPTVTARNNAVTLYLYVSITLGNASDSAYLSGGYITNN